MALDQAQFSQSVNALFDPDVCWTDADGLAESAAAYQNLAMHFIERHAQWLMHDVVFDPVRLGLMLKRFYRDAYGVVQFHDFLDSQVAENKLKLETKDEILKQVRRLSLRINSYSPRKTRIAAAFSLWASTMRPLCIKNLPEVHDERVWRLDATINFWIATRFLGKFGEIQIGVPGNTDDFDVRIQRIWYDFTFRDLNLSSLELMYASIFRPANQDVLA